MIPTIAGLTKEIQNCFGLFLFALKGRYLAITTSNQAISPALVSGLHSGAIASADSTLISAMNSVDAYVAIVSALADTETYARIQARREALQRDLHRIFNQCALSIGRDLKRTSTRLNVHGAMGLLAQQRAAEPIFTVKDSAGRSWSADKLVQFLVRDFAYQAYIDAALHEAGVKGDLAMVSYSDATHVNHGLVFSLSGSGKYPAVDEIRNSIFHPNSNAKVVSYVSPK